MIRRLAQRFFRWYCHPDYYDEIAGDLEELYHRNQEEQKSLADYRYALQVIGLFRPSLIRSFSTYTLMNQSMFKNYLKIGSRNLLRHKLFSTINVMGLALGLTAFLLINEYIRFESSYDRMFTDAGTIYRVSTIQKVNGSITAKDAMTYHDAPEVLVAEVPEVKEGTVSFKFGDLVFRKGKELVTESNVISADSNYLDLFDWEVRAGDPNTMLEGPDKLVLTESKARYYFGNENPLGKTIEILGQLNREFLVTGVIQDIPENTHYKFDILMSDQSIRKKTEADGWSGFNYYGFIRLQPGATPEGLEDKLVQLSRKYIGENDPDQFGLMKVQDIHLQSDFTYEPEAPNSEKTVAFLKLVALLILVIAWVNYINLTTARAVNRAKEVGLRKVIGAYKLQLVGQFLVEALMVNGLATLIACVLAQLLLPYFHQLIGTDILTYVWESAAFLRAMLIFFLLGTFISGIYPAIVLSGFQPITVLKGKFKNSRRGVVLRKFLVVSQFAASIVLIAGTAIVYKQLQYMQSKDLGIDTDYVVGFAMPRVENNYQAFLEKQASFRQQVTSHLAVEAMGSANHLPGGDLSDISSHSGSLRVEGKTDMVMGTTFMIQNNAGFIQALGMQLVDGRLFDPESKADSSDIMVNEAFLRKVNLSGPADILNEVVSFGTNENAERFTVVGVIKDYNRTSLKEKVEPTIYFPGKGSRMGVVKLNPERYEEGLAHLNKTWASFFPDTPLNYHFVDDRFDQLYRQDRRFGQIFGTFAALAIFIALLGLFGLAAFMSVQRSVEVGVRKVMGATVSNIVAIFYRDYLALLGIAGIVSLPLVYLGMSQWLEGYAFHITFPWLVALLALGAVVLFALLVVGYQIYKVAVLDPARTLKYE